MNGSLKLARDHFRDPPPKRIRNPKRSLKEKVTPDERQSAVRPPVVELHTVKAERARSAKPRFDAAARIGGQVAHAGISVGRKVWRAARWTATQSLQIGAKAGEALAKLQRSKPPVIGQNVEQSFYACLPNRLATLAGLSVDEQNAIRGNLPGRQIHQSGGTLLGEGEPMPRPTVILSGWACRTRVHDGRLHVLGILLPGDGINLFGPPGAMSSTAVCAMTTVETVNAQPVIDLVEQSESDSSLRLAMHRMMGEEEAFLLNQSLRATMKPPAARVAHLLLELQFRLARIGLASATEMPFPLDRRTVAAALALPPGVVGRAVRLLEARKLARFGHNRVMIFREDKLRKMSGFTPPAFSDGSGRKLINDIDDSDIVMPPEWTDVPLPQPARTFDLERRPA